MGLRHPVPQTLPQFETLTLSHVEALTRASVAECCGVLQGVADCFIVLHSESVPCRGLYKRKERRDTLTQHEAQKQDTARHCKTLQDTATHYGDSCDAKKKLEIDLMMQYDIF